jgi:AraC family transcriptional regulator, arabinose operon regulatory protein
MGIWRTKDSFSRWREQGTRDWLLTFTTGGLGRFGHVRGDLVVRPGDVVLIKPGTAHDYGLEQTLRRWDFVWAHFTPRPAWLPLFEWPSEHGLMMLRLQSSELRPRILKRLQEAHRLNLSHGHNREFFAMNALEEAVLWCDAANPRAPAAQIDPRISRTMEYICQNFAKPLTLNALATVSGLSPSRFAHLFRQEVDTTPLRFLVIQRLDRARELLAHSERPIQEIALEVGFQSQFYFSLRFKAQTGLSPSAYRQKVDKYDPLANDHIVNRRRNLRRNLPASKGYTP